MVYNNRWAQFLVLYKWRNLKREKERKQENLSRVVDPKVSKAILMGKDRKDLT